MPSLIEYLAEMEKAVERAQTDSEFHVHFGLRPLTAFPFAAAEAYNALPEVAAAYAKVSAWAFLRKRYRPSKSFERKERLVEGYVRAWQAYVERLLDAHLRYWQDMALDEATLLRVTTQHSIQTGKLLQAFAVPTPVQANSIDRIRNAGKMRRGLMQAWHAERWTESPEAEAIVMAELGYSST